jgi:hypothetical protein
LYNDRGRSAHLIIISHPPALSKILFVLVGSPAAPGEGEGGGYSYILITFSLPPSVPPFSPRFFSSSPSVTTSLNYVLLNLSPLSYTLQRNLHICLPQCSYFIRKLCTFFIRVCGRKGDIREALLAEDRDQD